MTLGKTISQLRQDRNLTQEELAAKLYVTRQAISRWETGETTPGIDMCKLIAITLGVPISCLLEMPEYPQCQSCGMPLGQAEDRGTEADGGLSEEYCQHCYQAGSYTYDASLEQMIERCAPFMAQYTDMTLDEAVSFMGAMLPNLKRWRVVQENERVYGAEARALYGDEVIDASNEKILAMAEEEWQDTLELEKAILAELQRLLPAQDPASEDARKLCAMHAVWLKRHWPEGLYSKEAHLGLAQGYLADQRFVRYYDEAAGEGATQYLVDALTLFLV